MAGTSCTSKVCEPGELGEHHLGVGLEQLLDAGANQRIVIGGLDPEPLQHVVAEPPRRAVDAVGDEHMVSRREKGEEGRGDGREP